MLRPDGSSKIQPTGKDGDPSDTRVNLHCPVNCLRLEKRMRLMDVAGGMLLSARLLALVDRSGLMPDGT